MGNKNKKKIKKCLTYVLHCSILYMMINTTNEEKMGTYTEALKEAKSKSHSIQTIEYLEKMSKFETIGVLLGFDLEIAADKGRAFYETNKNYKKSDAGTFQISLQVKNGLSYEESVKVAELVLETSR